MSAGNCPGLVQENIKHIRRKLCPAWKGSLAMCTKALHFSRSSTRYSEVHKKSMSLIDGAYEKIMIIIAIYLT